VGRHITAQKRHFLARRKTGEFGTFQPICEDVRPSVKRALEEHFFNMGSFDIHDSALKLPGLIKRYPTTVSTPEDLSSQGRKKAVAAIQQMVQAGEITLRELIGSEFIKPEAPIGYWETKEFARFWAGELVEAKTSQAKLSGRAQETVLKRFRGEQLSFFENMVYSELFRDAFCTLSGRDFSEAGLSGLFQIYGGKVHSISSGLYPKMKIKVWEVESKNLKEYFSSRENCAEAIDWLTWQFRKKFRHYSKAEEEAYLLYRNDSVLMVKDKHWKAVSRLGLLDKVDPGTLTEAKFLSKGLRKLVENYPSPNRLEKALADYYEVKKGLPGERKAVPKGNAPQPREVGYVLKCKSLLAGAMLNLSIEVTGISNSVSWKSAKTKKGQALLKILIDLEAKNATLLIKGKEDNFSLDALNERLATIQRKYSWY